MDMTIGTIAVAALLTIVLQVIYMVAPSIPDRWKSLVAIVVGMLLGVAAMFYNEPAIAVNIVVDYVLAGFTIGAAAVGLYEGERAFVKPRQ